MIARNPFDNVILPKTEYTKRDIWGADMIRTSLDKYTDSKLYVATNLAFACSLRFGEICGLTWDCVNISDAAILNDNAYLRVEKVLARVDEETVKVVGGNNILFTFPKIMAGKSKTRLVLKKTKTESSIGFIASLAKNRID